LRTRASRHGSRRSTATAGFPDVEPLLEAFASGVERVLGDDLVGIYIHGSLALGGFDPRNSDVDFVVATRDDLEQETVDRLAALHSELGERLDGSYLPCEVLRRFDPDRVMHPHIESRGGRLFVDHHGGETVIYRHVLRECGLVLHGPPPRELIDPVTAEELRWGVCDILENWWRPMLAKRSDELWEPPYRHYAIVTMCRVRFTLETGAVVPKQEAAQWALVHLDAEWHDLISRAAARAGCSYDETVAFVRATLAEASCA
jgi:predicted nucleotidyltransferase